MNAAADVKFVARSLLNRPGYTLAIVLILALVLGANAAMFSAVDATLLHPVAARDVDRLVVGWASDPSKNLPVVELSYRTFQDWTAASRTLSTGTPSRRSSFEQTAAFGSSAWVVTLKGPDGPERIASAGVSASFFDTLETAPALGRTFRPADDVPNAERVVILSHNLWVSRFGANPAIVGTTIALEQPHTVVGIMPAGFDFPFGVDVWTPVVPVLADASAKYKMDGLRDIGVLYVLGRLRNGARVETAASELDAVAVRLAQSGAPRPGTAVTVVPIVNFLLGPVREAMWALFAAVVVLLVIGCANVSGLLLARISQRRQEFAIRIGLGGRIAHLRRLCTIEAVILAGIGCLSGTLVSFWFVEMIVTLAPDGIPRLSAASINGRTVTFTVAAAMAAAVLCSIWAVRHLTAGSLTSDLRNATRDALAGSKRTRGVLVASQIGLAVVLLIAAGLIGRSVVNLARVDLGFTPSGILAMNVEPRPMAPVLVDEWYRELATRIGGLPDVDTVGVVSQTPLLLGPIGSDSWIVLEGQADTPATRKQNPGVNYQVASPEYFPAMRIALQQGRLFTERDDAQAVRVAVVSDRSARALWPGQNPVGKRILMPGHGPGEPATVWRTVVGVVADVRYRGMNDVRLDVYDTTLQTSAGAGNLIIRVAGDPAVPMAAIRSTIRTFDAEAIIGFVGTMDSVVARATAPWQFSVWVFGMFAFVACVLAAVGLFGLVALDASERRREFALRVAVGATRGDVLRLTFLRVSGYALAGIGCGLLAAIAGTRLIEGMLFGVTGLDVRTYAAVVALIVTIVALASYLPARRAAAIDPLPVLKGE